MVKRKTSKNKEIENKNPVHVKLNFEEAITSKKSVLSMEMWLLETAKNIERYKLLREKEFTLKLSLRELSKETIKDLKNLKSVLPKPDLPENIKKHLHKNQENLGQIGTSSQESKKGKIEEQLMEIQKRLDHLQSEAV